MMRRGLLLSGMAFALLVCPAACFGGWLAHEHEGTQPTDGGGHRSCVKHSCICAGATTPSTNHPIVAAAHPPVELLPVINMTALAALEAGANVSASISNPVPPNSCGILPLLI